MSTLSVVELGGEGSKRDRKKRDKEARIRAAALELFREKGFADTTTRAVAERAGIAAGTLFLYVQTKEELVDFVFSGEIAAVVERAFSTLPPRRTDVVARLMHLFGALLDFYAADAALARVLIAEAVLPRPNARSLPLTFAFLQRLAGVIGEAQDDGKLIAAAESLELGMHAFTLYVGGVLTVVNGWGSAADAKQTLRRALEIHFLGLRPRTRNKDKNRNRNRNRRSS
jgi:TetR/AcrR family transcriptional regulator, cholesterol catabolism regulator